MFHDAEARERRSQAKKKTAFAKWLDDPMVRLTMAAIPAGDQKEALRVLLESAFESGFNVGTGDVLTELVEAMIRKDKRPPDVQ